MEILSGKVLTTPPVASLESVAVMLPSKRRQSGNRAESDRVPKSMQVRQADAFSIAEGNRWVYRNGEISHTAAVSESQPRYTMISRQLGRACPLPWEVCSHGFAGREEGKRGGRQSDGRIVPEKAGNAAGGKPREGINPQSPAI